MSRDREAFQFNIFPNEIIYCIFDFLSTVDIVRIFSKLNRRYADLVQIYVKQLDLSNGWSGDYQQLQKIFTTIESLKIDRSHIYLLSNINEKRISIPSVQTKRTWRSIVNNILLCSRKSLTLDEPLLLCDSVLLTNQFSQLRSLKLVNVFQWSGLISNMNLKSLSLWFDGENRYFQNIALFPSTLERFSSNIIFDASYFHENLIDLTLCVYSIVHLLEIVEKTSNVQRLLVTFAENFDSTYYNAEGHQSDRFETMILSVGCLKNLNCLSFSTKDLQETTTNHYFPFHQIRDFIDRCCPDKTILKRISLKLSYIKFEKHLWSTIVRYKNLFDRFDFYASFIIEENNSKIKDTISIHDNFAFHIEGLDSTHSHGRFIHVYSLPFVFKTLYGFTRCSDLSSKCSFLSVRYLYFTKIRLNGLISFESLTKYMPYLIFIDCHLTFEHNSATSISEIMTERNIFRHIRRLCFLLNCSSKDCICRHLLPQLLQQMPQLESLCTSGDLFNYVETPLLSIKRLDLQEYYSISLDSLTQRVPHLLTLFLSQKRRFIDPLSDLIGPLFLGLPNLMLISFKIALGSEAFRVPYKNIAQQALFQAQTMNQHLRQLKCAFKNGRVEFYLPIFN